MLFLRQINAVKDALQQFQESGIDIAVASSNPERFVCHNFAIVYRWNTRVKNLFVDWILEQLKFGIHKDDQATLCRSMRYGRERYGLKYRTLSPNWALAFLSLDNRGGMEWWQHRTTRVIKGRPQVCHSQEGNICDLAITFDEESIRKMDLDSRPHIFYHNAGKLMDLRVFFNESEASSTLPYPYPASDWQELAAKCNGGLLCNGS
mmetsp:Transcript_19767/g.56812  ORF Transcript_19767/g.56812 Transcript_19767/m.56812 type:complete len:206 (+) Transcript_19767:614-1231(+)